MYKGLKEIIKGVQEYNAAADTSLIEKAFDFSKKYHDGQKRASGEPYLIHPIEVSHILMQMKMDVSAIVAGLLHDTVEDTDATLKDVEEKFGSDISYLVDGVTKISKIQFTSSQESQAESFRKMILAMSSDIRVIIIKLADRLNNMRTLGPLREGKRVRIAQETMDIYAPLANRLGIQWMKIELEDLSFKYLKPEIYKNIEKNLKGLKEKHESFIEGVKKLVSEKLNEAGVSYEFYGRLKHNLSIYRKMEDQDLTFEQVHDLMAFRIVVKDLSECYTVLGVLHELWKPVPGRFKDYVAMPKVNGYKSLHTTVVCLHGQRAEFQIRTREMHEIAEKGIAAHWKYKEGGVIQESERKKFQWLRELLDLQKGISDPGEFLDTVKLDLFATDVYVFTPKGDLKELAYGSTPIDFAYGVHSDIGNTCVGAKVDDKLVSLDYKLRSGDTIEILTNKNQQPNKDWLRFVKTSRAKAAIRSYIKSEQRDKSIAMGKEILSDEFKKFGESLGKYIKGKYLDDLLLATKMKDLDKLYANLGYGKLRASDVVSAVLPQETLLEPLEPKKETVIGKIFQRVKGRNRSSVRVGGYNDVLVTLGKCCSPLPGDLISGFVTRGRGVTVHTLDCPKILDSDPERRVNVEWDKNSDVVHRTKLKVVSADRTGVLASMTKIISSHGVNISQANIRTSSDEKAINIFHIEIKDADQLRLVIRDLEKLKGVIAVDRIRS